MKILDLEPGLHETYLHCLEEDWSDEIAEGGVQLRKVGSRKGADGHPGADGARLAVGGVSTNLTYPPQRHEGGRTKDALLHLDEERVGIGFGDQTGADFRRCLRRGSRHCQRCNAQGRAFQLRREFHLSTPT